MVSYIGYWQDKDMKKGSPLSPIITDFADGVVEEFGQKAIGSAEF